MAPYKVQLAIYNDQSHALILSAYFHILCMIGSHDVGGIMAGMFPIPAEVSNSHAPPARMTSPMMQALSTFQSLRCWKEHERGVQMIEDIRPTGPA